MSEQEDTRDIKGTDPNKDAGKVYTEVEVEARLRGQGAELKKLQDLLAVRDAKDRDREQEELKAQGEFKQLHEAASREAAEFKEKFESLAKKEDSRVEALTGKNTKRIQALPKDWESVVPRSMAPDEMANFLDELESRLAVRTLNVNGGSGRRGEENPVKADAKDWVFGKVNKKNG